MCTVDFPRSLVHVLCHASSHIVVLKLTNIFCRTSLFTDSVFTDIIVHASSVQLNLMSVINIHDVIVSDNLNNFDADNVFNSLS